MKRELSHGWFAPQGLEQQKNVYFRARAEFEIVSGRKDYDIKVAAESWYRLWCNGQEVAYGPARGSKTLAFFDTLSLSPYLLKGNNVIEVLVTCANLPTFKAAPIRPALWSESPQIELSWKVARDTAFDAAAPLYTFQIGYCEWADLRERNLDWHPPEYFSLCKELRPRDCALLEVTHHAPVEASFPTTLKANETLILPFGREITGGLGLEVTSSDGALLEISYAEHLTNGKLQVHYRNGDGHIDKTFADRYTTLDGTQVIGPTLQERGFQYVQICNLGAAAITIENATAVDRRQPLPAPNFKCEDNEMKRLYEIAHHTLSSSVTDTIADSPWREASAWANDMVVTATFWLCAGGDPRVIARCLRLSLSEKNQAGLIYGVCPSGDREEIVFLATNAFLPLILKELAVYDEQYLGEFLQPISEVMRALGEFGDGDGLLVGPSEYWNFLEWSFNFNDWDWTGRASASVNWFYVLALDTMAELSERAGMDASFWKWRADAITIALNTRFWNSEAGHYFEFEGEDKVSEIAQALACLSRRDADRTRTLSEKLATGEAEWLTPELYMMFFVLRVLVENGFHEAALARLKCYWWPMVEAGSPTLWEANVHQHGAQAFGGLGSLCHTFSCSPLWALPKIYLQY